MGKQTEMAKNAQVQRPGPTSSDDTGNPPTTPLRVSDADQDAQLTSEVEAKLVELGLKSERSDIRRGTNPAIQSDEDYDYEDDDIDVEGDAADMDGEDSGQTDDAADTGTNDDGDTTGEKELEGLPDALLRSAVAYDFGDEKTCREFYAKQPQQALNIFNSIYRARMQAMQDFAAEGRRHREVESGKQTAPVVEDKSAELEQKLAAAKEKLGDDVEPLLDIIRMQQKMLEPNLPAKTVQPTPTFSIGDQVSTEMTADEFAVEQQINLFFESDRMKPWNKVYGSVGFGETFDDLSPGNQKHRHSVLKHASDIVAGAKLNRRPITMQDALESAHMLVTQKYRDKVLIDGIKREAKKRHNAISVRPSKSKARGGKRSDDLGTPGSRTPEQLERAVTLKMRKVLGG
jgi:hypothetical protein